MRTPATNAGTAIIEEFAQFKREASAHGIWTPADEIVRVAVERAVIDIEDETAAVVAAGLGLVNTPAPGGVHTHGPEEGPGLMCREYLIGNCRIEADRMVDERRLARVIAAIGIGYGPVHANAAEFHAHRYASAYNEED